MRPGPLTQLTLPLDLPDLPPPIRLPCKPSVWPKHVWQTLSPKERAEARMSWLRVMQEVIDERR